MRWAVVLFAMLGACADDEAPSQPQDELPASSTGRHVMPAAVPPTPVRGTATVPAHVPLAFALDVEGVLSQGNWDVSGTVTRVGASRIHFVTKKRKNARFAFKLPQGMQLNLSAQDPIRVRYRETTRRGGIFWRLTVRSRGLALAAGRVGSSNPLAVRLPGIDLQQGQPGGTTRDNRFGTTRSVSVSTRVGPRTVTFRVGDVTPIVDRGRSLSVLIRNSAHVTPKPGRARSAESHGYGLEYVVVRP